MPKRLQCRTSDEANNPAKNAVYVGQDSKWANPFSHMVVGKQYSSLGIDAVHRMVERHGADLILAERIFESCEPIIGEYGRHLVRRSFPHRAEIVAELRGHDLVCWCELGEECHADVLLAVANEHLHHFQGRVSNHTTMTQQYVWRRNYYAGTKLMHDEIRVDVRDFWPKPMVDALRAVGR